MPTPVGRALPRYLSRWIFCSRPFRFPLGIKTTSYQPGEVENGRRATAYTPIPIRGICRNYKCRLRRNHPGHGIEPIWLLSGSDGAIAAWHPDNDKNYGWRPMCRSNSLSAICTTLSRYGYRLPRDRATVPSHPPRMVAAIVGQTEC